MNIDSKYMLLKEKISNTIFDVYRKILIFNVSKTNTRKPKKRLSLKVKDLGKVKVFRNHAFQRTLFQSQQIGQEIKKIDC